MMVEKLMVEELTVGEGGYGGGVDSGVDVGDVVDVVDGVVYSFGKGALKALFTPLRVAFRAAPPTDLCAGSPPQ